MIKDIAEMTISEEEWLVLNRVRVNGLVYFGDGRYGTIDGGIRCDVDQRHVRKFFEHGLLEKAEPYGYAGRYKFSERGRLAWQNAPAGMMINGRCDGCGQVAFVRPVLSDYGEYEFICQACS